MESSFALLIGLFVHRAVRFCSYGYYRTLFWASPCTRTQPVRFVYRQYESLTAIGAKDLGDRNHDESVFDCIMVASVPTVVLGFQEKVRQVYDLLWCTLQCVDELTELYAEFELPDEWHSPTRESYA